MSDPKDVLAVVSWYWRDWRASTARAVLSLEARAAYRELLDAHYGEADGSLPDDDRLLAALAGVSMAVWARIKGQILPFLPQTAEGRRANPRARAEWVRACEYRERCRAGGRARAGKMTTDQRSEVGKAAANARWAGIGQASGKHDPACDMPGYACTPSPSPSPSKDNTRQNADGLGGATPLPAEDPAGVSAKIPVREDAPPPIGPPDLLTVYNESARLNGWPVARGLTDKRRRAAAARLREVPQLDSWREMFHLAGQSDFLTGKSARAEGHKSWRPDLEWFLRPDTFTKIMEGSYGAGCGNATPEPRYDEYGAEIA